MMSAPSGGATRRLNGLIPTSTAVAGSRPKVIRALAAVAAACAKQRAKASRPTQLSGDRAPCQRRHRHSCSRPRNGASTPHLSAQSLQYVATSFQRDGISRPPVGVNASCSFGGRFRLMRRQGTRRILHGGPVGFASPSQLASSKRPLGNGTGSRQKHLSHQGELSGAHGVGPMGCAML